MDFDAFYLENYERTRRAMRLAFRDAEFAEDITQEAFYRALARWRKLSRLDRPDAWVLVVALNRGRTLKRRKQFHESKAPFLDTDSEVRSGDVLVDNRLLITELLADVSDRQRQALVLRYIGQLSVAEIAIAMGCAEGTVKATLSAAKSAAAKSKKGMHYVNDR
jgi:RNA polymerase sigma-70 factor, ECF subfamily